MSTFHKYRRTAQAIAALALLGSPGWMLAQTLPTGLQVMAGQASVTTRGNQMLVRNTNNAILNWQGFSIGEAHQVYFEQASATSKVLNRVVGNDPSAIFGSLVSNGQVWLLNPNGVLFGANARVDVQSLVTSTLRLNDNDFLNQRFRFTASEADQGRIRNEGSIRTAFGGQVVLLGSSVHNAGSITADGGTLTLAAGRQIELVDTGLPNLSVQVTAPEGQVLNLGSLKAGGGNVDIYGAIVNQQGLVQADRFATDGEGRITLKASDTLTLGAGSVTQAQGGAGTRGGDISATATTVSVEGGAVVDASGDSGGGRIRIGGGYQGNDSSIANAQRVGVAPLARLSADALGQGDGGTVVVWSDGTTLFDGLASVRGGLRGGDGGLVETSGKQNLGIVLGRVDLSSALGLSGRWLLDPQDIVVTVAGGAAYTSVSTFAAQPGTTQSISPAALNAVGGNVDLQATNGITVNDAINLSAAGATVSLRAGGDITVNAPVTATAGITLSANDAGGTPTGTGRVVTTAALTAPAVSITQNGSSGVHALGGDITASTLALVGNASLSAASTWNLSGNSTLSNVLTGSSGLTKAGAGTLTLSGASSYTGGTLLSAGTLVVAGASARLGSAAIQLNGGSTLDLINNASLGNQVIVFSGTVGSSSGAGTLSGPVSLSGGGTNFGLSSAGQLGLSLTGVISGPAGLNVTGVVLVRGANTYRGGTTIGNSAELVIAGGAASVLGTITVGPGGRLTATQGATVANAVNVTSGTLFGGAASANTFSGPISITGNVTIGFGLAGDVFSLTGPISGTGNLNTPTGRTGTLRLSGSNSYTGSTSFQDGVLQLVGGAALPDTSALTLAGSATLALLANETLGSLAGQGTVSLGANTLTLGGLNTSTSLSAVIAGTGGLAKVGSGTLTLDGPSTYSGGTTISGGTLRISGATATAGTGPITVDGNVLDITGGANLSSALQLSSGSTVTNSSGAATLSGPVNQLDGGGISVSGNALTVAGNISGGTGTSSLTVNSGSVTFTGANTRAGTTTINSGATLTIGNGGATGQLDGGNVTNNGVLVFSRSGALSVPNAIGGTGRLNMRGPGAVTLAGDNTYTGFTNVSSGTLIASGANALPDTSAVFVDQPATLALGGNDTVASLALAGTLSGAGTLTAASYTLVGPATVNANLGAGALISIGSSITLSGTAAAGTVAVNSGVLTLASANRLTGSPAVTVAAGATLSVGGNTSLGSLINIGTLNVNAGALQVGGALTQAGTLRTEAGTSFQTSAAFTNALGGVLTGTGTIRVGPAGTDTLTNLGTISPGSAGAAGTLTVGGNLDLATGSLSAKLGGPTAGASDRLVASGSVSLGGSLNATLLSGYTPANGDAMAIVAGSGTATGTFAQATLPTGFTLGYNVAAGEAARVVFGNVATVQATSSATTNSSISLTNTSLTQVQVPVAMSSPTEGRVLDVTVGVSAAPGAASNASGGGSGVFQPVNFRRLSRAEIQTLLAARAAYKQEVLGTGIALLEQDPKLADVQPCVKEEDIAKGNCLVTEALRLEIQAKQLRTATTVAVPDRRRIKQADLPKIDRKLALLIGVNVYRDKRVPELTGAVPDAQAVKTLMENRLGYEATVLVNATREDIIRGFNRLALEARAEDSVVIYYAGHGVVVPSGGQDQGYWLPADSDAEQPASWISNADIARMVSIVGARQVLLVSDSCYSGSLAGGERVQVSETESAALLSRRAVVVMSSGGDEPVADEGYEGHSIFAWHFMRALEGLDNWQLGGNVFARVRSAVSKEFPQTPQYGASRSAGHAGNTDYLFERREFEKRAP